MSKTIMTFFALVGIFLCGAIVGGVVSVRYANVTVQKKAADRQLSSQQWVRITNRLDPTPEQKEKIRALVAEYMEAQQSARKIERAATAKLHGAIRDVLTPEQATAYEKHRTRVLENEKLWQRWYKEQRSKHGESPLVSPKPVGGKDPKGNKPPAKGGAAPKSPKNPSSTNP